MDALLIARMEFATTTSLHFLFVLLTLGLVPLVAVMQTRYTITGRSVHRRMTRFWGMLYLINYALGIATGIVMEFQFGLNWSGLSAVGGNVFGAPLALETLLAFFLESTFLGLWIFGWDRLNKWVHLAAIWLVAITAYVSVYWVMVANEFMHRPRGFAVRDGVVHLTDLAAVMISPNLVAVLLHIVAVALVTGGMFLSGVSAYHFIKRTNERDLFRRSLRLGVLLVAVAAPVAFAFGTAQLGGFRAQPGKVVDQGDQARLQAMFGPQFGSGDYTAPQWPLVLLGYMILIGMVITLGAWLFSMLLVRDWLIRIRVPLYVMWFGIPVPFVVAIFGWVSREVGRQPWVIYGVLRTEDAASGLPLAPVLTSYIAFTALLLALAVTNWLLIAKVAARGPGAEPWLAPPVEPSPETIIRVS